MGSSAANGKLLEQTGSGAFEMADLVVPAPQQCARGVIDL